MIRVLISACLLGQPVRYDGRGAEVMHLVLQRWSAEGRLVAVCPEMAGGLPVPRPAAEITGGEGADVLKDRARVMTRDGDDVTHAFIAGAQRTLAIAQIQGCGVAILTEKSPSCGSTVIYDGSFARVRRAGQGVTAALLEQHGIRVFNQHQLDAAMTCLDALECAGLQGEP